MRRLLLLSLFPLVACSASSDEESTLNQKSSPIVGGVVDKAPGAHEGVVLLSLTTQGGACTGSMIAPNLVLTARHCVSNNITEGIGCDPDGNSTNGDHVSSDFAPSSILVFNGTNPAFWSGKGIAKGTKIFHPSGFNLCNNDIALVLLDKSIDSLAPTMKLRLNYGAQIGELTTAVGYGKTSQNSWESGVRYRRDKIPVLSVGRDFNEYLGENEFIMGQSTCQGDSGGPILAYDSQAILGVTSRGGNCDTGKQRFTRVDAHKALIESALAEAGSAAQLEGKTPPAPVPPTATGDGPCSTGAQCTGDFCYQNTCSSLCSAGFCPTGYSCLPTTVTIADQTVPDVGICRIYTGVDSCDTCRHSKCKTLAEQCHFDKDCSAMLACVAKCTTPDCYDTCAAKNSKGAAQYGTLHTCECSNKCNKDCAGLCGKDLPGTGGAGGTGAAGSDPGTAGSDPGTAGSDPGTAGSDPGTAGSDPGTAGSDPGTAGSDPGTAGTTSAGGTGGSSAGAPQAGSGGVAAAGGGGVPAGPSTEGTSADSGDGGGCSTTGTPAGSGAGWLFALAAVAFRRRPRRSAR